MKIKEDDEISKKMSVFVPKLKVILMLVPFFSMVYLGGGFKYFSFSPLLGEDSHFDEHIFQMG